MSISSSLQLLHIDPRTHSTMRNYGPGGHHIIQYLCGSRGLLTPSQAPTSPNYGGVQGGCHTQNRVRSLLQPRLVLASACALRPSRDGQETVRPTLCGLMLPSSLWAGPPLWESGIMGPPPPGNTLVLPSPPPSNPWKTSRGLGARGRGVYCARVAFNRRCYN